jgi:hypothetical protein
MGMARHYSSGQCYAVHTDIGVCVGFGFAIQRRAPFENESFVGAPCESRFRGGPDPSKQKQCSLILGPAGPPGPVLSAFVAIFARKMGLKLASSAPLFRVSHILIVKINKIQRGPGRQPRRNFKPFLSQFYASLGTGMWHPDTGVRKPSRIFDVFGKIPWWA